MADWTYTPTYSYVAEVIPPKTLITQYDDGKEDRRQKASSFRRRFVEKHVVDGTDAAAMITFFKARGLLTSFSKVSFDPEEAPATEVTVRFVGSLRFEQVSSDEFETEIEFLEEL